MDISVVICTFNNSASLRATLRSLAAVQVPDGLSVELCLIDNNSPDDTRLIYEAEAASLPFASRYFFEATQGLSHARNRGLREAVGEFVVYTDDDVLVSPDWLQCYSQSLLALGADAAFGRIVPQWRGPEPWFFQPELRAAYALLDYGPNPWFVSQDWQEFFGANFAVRRSLLTGLGGFDPRLGRTKGAFFVGEERQVFLGLRKLGARIHYDPANAVQHVIADSRKNTTFLRRYFRDIASSHVCADTLEPRRWIGMMPAYRWRELASFVVQLPVSALWALLTGNRRRLLFIELRIRTLVRMLALFRALPATSRIAHG